MANKSQEQIMVLVYCNNFLLINYFLLNYYYAKQIYCIIHIAIFFYFLIFLARKVYLEEILHEKIIDIDVLNI